jgi:hypothetical protein
MKPDHLRTQSALVRMIYDPNFAAAVKAAPRAVLSHLPPALADELGAIDLRALRRDGARRERTLGQLCDELPASTMLALVEERDILLGFYASAQFHEAIEEGQALVFALAAFLQSRLAEDVLHSPALAAVLAIELACARARRDGEDAPRALAEGRLRRARGVEPISVPSGTLAILHAAMQHARTTEPFVSSPLGPEHETLCAVAIAGEVSVVQIERPLYAVLLSAASPRARAAIVEEAALRLAGDRVAAEAAVTSLIADELLVSEP